MVLIKSTGLVRKIDELGRLVIPKEIRRTLNIKDGEDIEIYIENDTIVLKKYYRLLTLKDTTSFYLKQLEKHFNCNILVTDREKIILSLKEKHNYLVGQNISKNILESINERKPLAGVNDLYITKEEKLNDFYWLQPILVNADALGSVICLSDKNIDEKNKNLVDILISLLKNHLGG